MVDDEAALSRWAERYRASARRTPPGGFLPIPETLSGLPLAPLYTPDSVAGQDYAGTIGYPGEFPYTRGVYPSMYRDKLFTMRQFAGFGSAAETNQRYRFLLGEGQTGLSVAFDLPTLMGRDSDDPLGQGEVGRCGVAIDSLEDMDRLFSGIDLGQVTTSMTINSPAAILLAMYVAVAERQGVAVERLGGTLQNDILKEYIAQKEQLTTVHPGSASSSTATWTSSRRWPSTGRRGASGPGGCGTATAPRTSAPGCSASTPRPRAAL
jgi:methylmalonyl-CoA mutase N-terminal domain/subunit